MYIVHMAFHWFKAEIALKEFHRILRPNGVVALVWNYHPAKGGCLEEIWDMLMAAIPGAVSVLLY